MMQVIKTERKHDRKQSALVGFLSVTNFILIGVVATLMYGEGVQQHVPELSQQDTAAAVQVAAVQDAAWDGESSTADRSLRKQGKKGKKDPAPTMAPVVPPTEEEVCDDFEFAFSIILGSVVDEDDFPPDDVDGEITLLEGIIGDAYEDAFECDEGFDVSGVRITSITDDAYDDGTGLSTCSVPTPAPLEGKKGKKSGSGGDRALQGVRPKRQYTTVNVSGRARNSKSNSKPFQDAGGRMRALLEVGRDLEEEDCCEFPTPENFLDMLNEEVLEAQCRNSEGRRTHECYAALMWIEGFESVTLLPGTIVLDRCTGASPTPTAAPFTSG